MGTMFDTTDSDPAQTFHGLDVEAAAAYGNGSYANYEAAHKAFPHLHVLEVDVDGAGVGKAGDFEKGDMPYSEAGSWAKRRIAAGIKRPVIYFSVTAWPEVIDSLKAAGVAREDVRLWTAHYDGRPHLCSSACAPGVTGTADATQWGSHGTTPATLPPEYANHNIDVSQTSDSFFD
jgi:hypothetical protein